jgi:ABC-type sugar transport system permease subunit
MRRYTPYMLLAPALLFTVFILVYPMAQNLVNSFRDVSLVREGRGWTGTPRCTRWPGHCLRS